MCVHIRVRVSVYRHSYTKHNKYHHKYKHSNIRDVYTKVHWVFERSFWMIVAHIVRITQTVYTHSDTRMYIVQCAEKFCTPVMASVILLISQLTLIVICVLIYLTLTFIRRPFCFNRRHRTFCPSSILLIPKALINIEIVVEDVCWFLLIVNMNEFHIQRILYLLLMIMLLLRISWQPSDHIG